MIMLTYLISFGLLLNVIAIPLVMRWKSIPQDALSKPPTRSLKAFTYFTMVLQFVLALACVTVQSLPPVIFLVGLALFAVSNWACLLDWITQRPAA